MVIMIVKVLSCTERCSHCKMPSASFWEDDGWFETGTSCSGFWEQSLGLRNRNLVVPGFTYLKGLHRLAGIDSWPHKSLIFELWARICTHFKELAEPIPGGTDSSAPWTFTNSGSVCVCLGWEWGGGGGREKTTVIQHQIYPVLYIWATIGQKKTWLPSWSGPYVGRPIIWRPHNTKILNMSRPDQMSACQAGAKDTSDWSFKIPLSTPWFCRCSYSESVWMDFQIS